MNRQDADTPFERRGAEGQRRREPAQALNHLTESIIGAAIAVHREIGPGLPESVYEEALCIELTERGIPFERQPAINIFYHERLVGQGRLDLWIDRRVVVELKAIDQIAKKHKAQAKAYLAATGCEIALLINFHEATLLDGLHRIVLTQD